MTKLTLEGKEMCYIMLKTGNTGTVIDPDANGKNAFFRKKRSYMQTFIRHCQLQGDHERPLFRPMVGRSKNMFAIHAEEQSEGTEMSLLSEKSVLSLSFSGKNAGKKGRLIFLSMRIIVSVNLVRE